MRLVVSIEQGPTPQAVRQASLRSGALVIGRGADADLRIDDPDMFVSRAHCTIEAGPTGFIVTDTSTGGLFVDDARTRSAPATAPRSATAPGSRIDFLLRVRIAAAVAPTSPEPWQASAPPPAATTARSPFDGDDFFASPRPEPAPPRPADLPGSFRRAVAPRYFAPEPATPARPSQPFFDDPFTLDPLPSAPPPPVAPPTAFDWPAPFAAPAAGRRGPNPRARNRSAPK